MTDLIGANLTLIEEPDQPAGRVCKYLSAEYNVTVGRTYQILDRNGSCVIIKDNDGLDAHIYHGRFEPIAY